VLVEVLLLLPLALLWALLVVLMLELVDSTLTCLGEVFTAEKEASSLFMGGLLSSDEG